MGKIVIRPASSQKKIKIVSNNNNNTSKITLHPTTYTGNKYLEGINSWDSETLVEKLGEIYKEDDIKYLYENYPMKVNEYTREKYYGKFDGANIYVLSFNKLQEFYVPKMIGKTLMQDPVISYMLKYSEFIKDSTTDLGINDMAERMGVIIFQELPEFSYQVLFGNCDFNIENFTS